MYLNSFAFTHFFEFFTCIWDVGNNYGGLSFGFVCGTLIVGGVGGVVGLLLRLDEPVVPLVEGPGGELTVFECCFDVVQFFVQAVLCGRNCLGPMCQGVEYTLFSCDVVIAVPV